MCVCFHHLINDGAGAGVFIQHVCRSYNAIEEGAVAQIQGVFPSFVGEIKKDSIKDVLINYSTNSEYWVSKLARSFLGSVFYTTGLSNLASNTPGGVLEFPISVKLKDRIKEYAKINSVSALHFFLAVLFVILAGFMMLMRLLLELLFITDVA